MTHINTQSGKNYRQGRSDRYHRRENTKSYSPHHQSNQNKSRHNETNANFVPPAQIGVKDYERKRDLPRLIPLWPSELNDFSQAGSALIIAKIRKALRGERTRGRAGHWSYDLNRHMGLAEALKGETALQKISRYARFSAKGTKQKSPD